MIKTVIRTKNDMVLVFDEHGRQIPQYQGPYTKVKSSILANACSGSIFNHWFGYKLVPEVVTRNAW